MDTENIQELFQKRISRVTFKRTINLFGATTIGVGALMGAGVYVLIGIAAGAAGPSVILSYLLCGLLAYITTLMYAELGRIIPRSGGGYIYVYDTLGGIAGFATGWFLALGSIFACGLYAIGFAEYAVTFTGLKMPGFFVKLIAIVAVGILAYLNTRPAKGKFNLQAWLTWGNLAILGILVIFSLFQADPGNITPVFPKGFGGTTSAISLIYISFFGYQLIANNADEIIKPEKTVPKAMKLSMIISISVYVLIAVVSVMAVSWEKLAASNAPLVVLANKSFGGYGWLLISFGGVLASLAALSSTISSQSRQVYVMGEHRFFPDMLGKLDEKTRKPRAALIAGAVIIAVILLLSDLEFIAKSANFCLLVSLLPVSIALRKIYFKEPSKRPKQFWKQFLPEIALIANLVLLFTLDLVSLAFGQQLALAGAAIYFFYSRKREKRSRGGVNIALQERKEFKLFGGNRILVPMANPQTQEALFTLSRVLLSKRGGEIDVLAVKNVPSDMDFYEALADSGETLEIIERSVELAKAENTTIKPVIRASHNIATGIVEAAEEVNSDFIVMGYTDHKTEKKANIMDKVLTFAAKDIVVLKLHNHHVAFNPKRIALCVRGKPNLDIMVMVATALAEEFKGKITLLHILPPDYGKKQKQKADKAIVEAIQSLDSLSLYEVKLEAAENAVEALIRFSKDYDLLIIGTTSAHLTEKAISNSFSINVAEKAHCSVVMVKEVSGFKKLVSRI